MRKLHLAGFTAPTLVNTTGKYDEMHGNGANNNFGCVGFVRREK
ncbi:MAG TPA: hypothetical protein VLD19_00520 [Chitinophagaceae bacterium]|nr:hypothetical protein [Chitinophagaceae bacterium]